MVAFLGLRLMFPRIGHGLTLRIGNAPATSALAFRGPGRPAVAAAGIGNNLGRSAAALNGQLGPVGGLINRSIATIGILSIASLAYGLLPRLDKR